MKKEHRINETIYAYLQEQLPKLFSKPVLLNCEIKESTSPNNGR